VESGLLPSCVTRQCVLRLLCAVAVCAFVRWSACSRHVEGALSVGFVLCVCLRYSRVLGCGAGSGCGRRAAVALRAFPPLDAGSGRAWDLGCASLGEQFVWDVRGSLGGGVHTVGVARGLASWWGAGWSLGLRPRPRRGSVARRAARAAGGLRYSMSFSFFFLVFLCFVCTVVGSLVRARIGVQLGSTTLLSRVCHAIGVAGVFSGRVGGASGLVFGLAGGVQSGFGDFCAAL
jgi:hypothetical protein